MKKFFPALLFAVSLFCCCGKSGSDTPAPTPTPAAPTTITLSSSAISAQQAGGSYDVTITAPARPTLTLPAWISKKDGTYSNYKITLTLVVAANDTYAAREADITVKAAGAADVTLKVSQAGKEEVKDPTLPDNTAVARTLELGLGWNMGNHFDAYANGVASETAWQGKKATQATFTGLKEKGFSSVRIPVTWMGHIGEAPDYVLDEEWLGRVYEVVGFAEKAGLNVILNTHHDEDHGEADGHHWQNLKGAVDSEDVNKQVKEEIAAVWSQIATKFKDKGSFLMLESFNELIYGDEWASKKDDEKRCNVINEWNQVFVDAVRATGGNNATRWLGVPGYAASPNYLKYIKVPTDPAGKIMLAFHCYDPYDYTIRTDLVTTDDKNDGLWVPSADWGHTGPSIPTGEEEIKTLYNSIYTNYIAKNIPIYMGEFGCSMRNKNDAKAWAYFLYYLEYVVKAARSFGFAPFLWDNGAEGYGQERHGYVDHGSGEYTASGKEPVEAMVKAWSTTDASYTLQSVYDSAPKF